MSNIYDITEEEIEALAYYTSRKNDGILDLKGYSSVNGFLRKIVQGKPDLIPIYMSNYEQFKDYLNHIEKLFSLSCKYGATHKIPYRIYRGYDGASKLNYQSKIDKYGKRYWMADQFLSCSLSESETRVFSDLETMYIDTKTGYIEEQNIPFIDVNDILGSSQMYGDESEILIPPFLNLEYKGQEKTRTRVYYDLELTPFVAKQTIEEELDELTDDDIKRYYDLSKEYNKINDKQIKEELEQLTKKIKNDLHYKLNKIQYKYMSYEAKEKYQSEQQEKHSHR